MNNTRWAMQRFAATIGTALGAIALYAATPESNTPEKKEKLETMTLSIKKGLDFEFVKCPAGTFTMGVIGDLEEKSPKREHKVTLTRPFWMMTKKVTWKQWKANGGKVAWCEWVLKSLDVDKFPAFRISYNDVQKFSDKMTKRFKTKLPKGYVLRLPTEAEWEYALNANCEDSNNPYVAFRDTGNDADKIMAAESDLMKLVPPENIDCIKEIKKQGLWKFPCHVGTKLPNAWGLYDMLANGGEMTLDVICYGKIEFWEEAKLSGKLTYQEEETDPFKFDPWGDVCIARGTPRNRETHKGDWYAKDVAPLDRTKFSQRGFRLVIGPDYIGEWKAKNAAKAKANKGKTSKKGKK